MQSIVEHIYSSQLVSHVSFPIDMCKCIAHGVCDNVWSFWIWLLIKLLDLKLLQHSYSSQLISLNILFVDTCKCIAHCVCDNWDLQMQYFDKAWWFETVVAFIDLEHFVLHSTVHAHYNGQFIWWLWLDAWYNKGASYMCMLWWHPQFVPSLHENSSAKFLSWELCHELSIW